MASQVVSFGFGLDATGATTSLKLDDQGIGTHAFGSPGSCPGVRPSVTWR